MMKTRRWKVGAVLVLCLAWLTVFSTFGYAEGLSVAVLNFETKDRAIIGLGTKIADMLSANLSLNPQIELVERDKLKSVLDELELGLSGVVNSQQAAQIGQLTGAKILVTGRAFTVDKDLIIVAKVIATETSKVQAEVAKGSLSSKLTPIVETLSTKVVKVILKKGPQMIAKPEKPGDKIETIRTKLEGKELPKVSVVILERHVGATTIDPAAETEITFYLKKLGFTVVGKKALNLSDWAKEYLKDANIEIPESIGAEVVIIGEAFSEFATRRSNLISCKARVEIQAIDCHTGKLLSIDRQTNVAVDLSEQIAAKAAIQEAAADIASRLIPEFVEAWNRDKK